MRTIRIKAYKFSELDKPSKRRALVSVSRYICEFIGPNSRFNKPAKEVEEGFLIGHLVRKYESWILAEIEINNYEFTADGKMI